MDYNTELLGQNVCNMVEKLLLRKQNLIHKEEKQNQKRKVFSQPGGLEMKSEDSRSQREIAASLVVTCRSIMFHREHGNGNEL